MEEHNPSSVVASSVESALASVSLSEDEATNASRNLSSFFRSIEEGNLQLLNILIRKAAVNINAYNDQGMTAVHLSVYKFETQRKLDILEFLLEHGANPCLKAASRPQATKLSIARHDSKSHSDMSLETKKISLDQKTPLLLALELKSALYLRGWEYRHWDAALKVLAGATVKHISTIRIHEELPNTVEFVRRGWNSVFESGNHSVVEVCAEGKEISALKVLLSGSSKKLKLSLEAMAMRNSSMLELKDISFSLAKTMIKFIYTGTVDPDFMSHRGIDLLQAAHKYGVDALKALCEIQIQPTQENWIKLLTAAGEVDSDLLVLKCAKSIEDVMVRRHEGSHMLRKSFSESGHDGPNQLFHVPESPHVS